MFCSRAHLIRKKEGRGCIMGGISIPFSQLRKGLLLHCALSRQKRKRRTTSHSSSGKGKNFPLGGRMRFGRFEATKPKQNFKIPTACEKSVQRRERHLPGRKERAEKILFPHFSCVLALMFIKGNPSGKRTSSAQGKGNRNKLCQPDRDLRKSQASCSGCERTYKFPFSRNLALPLDMNIGCSNFFLSISS